MRDSKSLCEDTLHSTNENSKKDCAKCLTQLWGFILEETTHEQDVWMERHLQSCPSCLEEHNRLKSTIELLNRAPVPAIPDDFSAILHQKLTVAAAEMEAIKNMTFRERLIHRINLAMWKEKFLHCLEPAFWQNQFKRLKNSQFRSHFEQFIHLDGWKVMAPALVCITLSIGVFSTGLYKDWMSADDILISDYAVSQSNVPSKKSGNNSSNAKKPDSISATKKPANIATASPTATAMATAKPSSSVAIPSGSPSDYNAGIVLYPAPTVPPARTIPPATRVPAPAITEAPIENQETPALANAGTGARVQLEPSESPMPAFFNASGDSSARAADDMPQVLPDITEQVYMILVPETDSYLDDFKAETKLDLLDMKQDIEVGDVVSKANEDSLVLKLSNEDWEILKSYTTEIGVLPYLLNDVDEENEILVVITKYEE